MKWQPVVDGNLRAQALAAAAEIARALRVPTDLQTDSGESRASLPGGHAGLALLFAYLAEADVGDHDFPEVAIRYLESAIAAASDDDIGPALHGGLTGTAWTVEHLRARWFNSDDDPNGDVDSALLACVSQSPWHGSYDLISGLVGIGVYALERLPGRPLAGSSATRSSRDSGSPSRVSTAIEILEQITSRFEEMAVWVPGGATWHTAPELLPAHEREIHPEGHYNLGLAHGVPAVIALLAHTLAAGIATDAARRLLGASVPWLLARRQDDEVASAYTWAIPAAVEREPLDPVEPENCRLAWCYGDPGVAVALLSAARACGEEHWEGEALAAARRAARRPLDSTGVIDAGLCHGAAGLALVFQRLFCTTGDPELGAVARTWVERTLELRRPGEEIAGFPSFNSPSSGSARWHRDPGLLTGAAGVALALVAASTPLEPRWDRALLLSRMGFDTDS